MKIYITLSAVLAARVNANSYGTQDNHAYGVDTKPQVTNSGVCSNTYTDDIRDYIVEKHNWARANLVPSEACNMRVVQWDESLAISASDWVERCEFEHYTEGYAYGQNLMYGGDNLDKAAVDGWIQAWVEEEISDNDRRGDGMMDLDHASAVLWADTFLVGCASKMCPKGYLTACNYFNPGNMQGEKTYEPGVGCSKCPPQAPHCDASGKLCRADADGKPAYGPDAGAGNKPSTGGHGGYAPKPAGGNAPKAAGGKPAPAPAGGKAPCPTAKPVAANSYGTPAPKDVKDAKNTPCPTTKPEVKPAHGNNYGPAPTAKPAHGDRTPCPVPAKPEAKPASGNNNYAPASEAKPAHGNNNYGPAPEAKPAHGEKTPCPGSKPEAKPVQGNHYGPAPAAEAKPAQGTHYGPAPAPEAKPAQGNHYGPAPAPEVKPAQGNSYGAPEAKPAQGNNYGPAPAPEAKPAQGNSYGPAPAPDAKPAQGNNYAPAPATKPAEAVSYSL